MWVEPVAIVGVRGDSTSAKPHPEYTTCPGFAAGTGFAEAHPTTPRGWRGSIAGTQGVPYVVVLSSRSQPIAQRAQSWPFLFLSRLAVATRVAASRGPVNSSPLIKPIWATGGPFDRCLRCAPSTGPTDPLRSRALSPAENASASPTERLYQRAAGPRSSQWVSAKPTSVGAGRTRCMRACFSIDSVPFSRRLSMPAATARQLGLVALCSWLILPCLAAADPGLRAQPLPGAVRVLL